MRKADALTLLGGSLATLALVAGITGDTVLALRLLFLSYALDVLDGWVARRFDTPDERGELLDRSLDRFSQIVVPSLLYMLAFIGAFTRLETALMALYMAVMIPYVYYRLVYRRTGARYFPGAPLFTHTLVMLGAILAEKPLTPLLLLLTLLSVLPIPYYRRTSEGGSPHPWPRAIALLLLTLVPGSGTPARILGYLMIVGGLGFALLGWIPLYKPGETGKNI